MTRLAPLTYKFNEIRATLERKQSKKLRINVDYMGQHRADTYQGYNNSLYNKLKFSSRYKINEKLTQGMFIQGSYRSYFDAKAYDTDPLLEDKFFTKVSTGLNTKYKLSKAMKAKAGIEYEKQTSSDKRYEYNRYILLLSLVARY